MKTLVHYDCDPGQDDAVALLYALASPKLEITGVSVVGGNANVDQCGYNALKILKLAGREDMAVYRGAQQPLVRPLITLPEVFGEDGLAGAEKFPAPVRKMETISAAAYLEKYISQSAKPVTICATGPLTNLAEVLQKRPELAQNIGTLVLMGGCPYPEPLRGEMGNFTPPGATGKAEYNFAIDPEAVAVVMAAGIPDVTIVGLNVTRAVLYNWRLDARLRATGDKIAIASADIFAAVGEEDRKSDYIALREKPDDPVRAMHDVLAFAWMDSPDLFETKMEYLKCYTTESGGTPGLCHPVENAVDATTKTKVRLAVSVDKKGFADRMVELLGGIQDEQLRA